MLSRNENISHLENADDLSLMKLIQNGDRDAFAVLMERHEDKVFALAFRIVNDRAGARDIAQEVFINLWNNPFSWKPKAKFTTWVYRVTFNRSLNHKRAGKLKSFLPLSNPEVEKLDSFPKEDSPDESMLREESKADFNSQYEKLPPKQKTALHLRYWENLSVKDVAQSLGVSFKSAESLIFRAKKTLKKSLSRS